MKGGFARLPAVLSWLLLSLAIFPAFGALSGPLIGEFNEENEEVERQRAEQRRADIRQPEARGAPPQKEAERTRSASAQRLASNFWDEVRRNLRNDLSRQRQYQRHQYLDERRQQAIEQRRLEAEQRWQEREWYREQSRLELERRRQAEAERERQAQERRQAAAEAARLADEARQQQAVRDARQRAEVARLAVETQRAETERLALEAKKAEAVRIRWEREQQEREMAAQKRAEQERLEVERQQRAREQVLLEERQQEEKRQQVEALRQQGEIRAWAEQLMLSLPLFSVVFFFLLLVPPYRHYIEYRFTIPSEWNNAPVIAFSGLFLLGFAGILFGGYAIDHPVLLLTFWILGIPALCFVPGVVWIGGVYVSSLFVPHPMEVSLRKLLRTGKLDEAEAAHLAQKMYHAERDGLPSDWRVNSRLWRLDRLNKLMEKEMNLAQSAAENLMNQQKKGR